MIVVFLGAPGAGKGTQAAVVAQELKLAHISSGDLFRKAVERGDELGRKVKSYMERGVLVPDEITTGMVLEQMEAGGGRGAVLDGYPRNLSQARALDEALAARGKAIGSAVYIEVAEEELLRRLSCRWICRSCQAPHNLPRGQKGEGQACIQCGGALYQRPDDRVETIKRRLEVYFTETAPLIEYYNRREKLIRVNGEGEIGVVAGRIVRAMVSEPQL